MSSQENVNVTHEGTTEDVLSAECDADFFGPSLPPHLLKKNSQKSEGEKIYGPTLPINFSQNEGVKTSTTTTPTSDEKNETLIGPELPEHLKPATTTLDEEEELTPGFSDDNYGPSTTLMTTGDVTDYYKFKIVQAPNKESESKSVVKRASWMTELPENKKSNFRLLQRHFKSRIPTDKESDSSVWTETPADKKQKKHNEKDSKEILKKKRLQERDKEMEKLAKKAAKKLRKKESLLEMHQKKMKKKEKKEAEKRKKKGETLQERRPFDRNIDLQIRKVDENQKRAMLNKSQFLNDRFAPGESKFL